MAPVPSTFGSGTLSADLYPTQIAQRKPPRQLAAAIDSPYALLLRVDLAGFPAPFLPVKLHPLRDFFARGSVHGAPAPHRAGLRRVFLHCLKRFDYALQAVSFLHQLADNAVQVHVSSGQLTRV